MRPYNAIKDNCLQCCIAGILDLSLDKVVNPVETPNYWVDSLRLWCEQNDVRIRCTYDTPILNMETRGLLYIGVISWDISKSCHAVIMQGGFILHDPNSETRHTQPTSTTLYNIILTKGDTYESIFKDNGELISTFMDSKSMSEAG